MILSIGRTCPITAITASRCSVRCGIREVLTCPTSGFTSSSASLKPSSHRRSSWRTIIRLLRRNTSEPHNALGGLSHRIRLRQRALIPSKVGSKSLSLNIKVRFTSHPPSRQIQNRGGPFLVGPFSRVEASQIPRAIPNSSKRPCVFLRRAIVGVFGAGLRAPEGSPPKFPTEGLRTVSRTRERSFRCCGVVALPRCERRSTKPNDTVDW